jgi:hypothetical protein
MPNVSDVVKAFEENRCAHCLGSHLRACPRVVSQEWHPSGELAKVVFDPDFYDKYKDCDWIVWPEDVYGDYTGDNMTGMSVEPYRP